MSIIHKTAKGKEIDMNRLASQNELTVAVSNVKINARGDELGPGGQIIRKHEDVIGSGVPVEQQSYQAPAPKPAPVKPPVSKPVPQPALVQPVINTETVNIEKPNKGK